MTAYFKSRRGSVTIMAVMILLVLGGLMAVTSPMIISEVKMNTVNRDMIEAQYAAEAGAKVGIAAIYAGKTSWNWLGLEKFQPLIPGSANKQYSVAISPTPPSTDEGWKAGDQYTITSKGVVNGATKTVSVKVKVGGESMPEALSNMVFGNASIIMDSNAKIFGSAGTNGYISMASTNNAITGVATYNKNIQKSSSGAYNYPLTSVGSENGVTTALTVPTFTVTYTAPAAPTKPAVPSSTSSWDSLVGTWQVTKSVPAGNYSTSGILQSGQSTITTAANTGIYVNGSANLYKSTWNMGNNTLMYMNNGGLSLTGNTRMTMGSNSKIYMTGFLDVNESLIMGTNSTLYAGLGMQLEESSTVTLPGAATIYLANNSSHNVSGYSWIANNKSVLNLGTVGQASVLYCNGSANLGGTVNINGPTSGTEKTRIYLTGNMDFNNDAVINIAGNVEIYISGTMKINNSVKINTAKDANVVFKMGGYTEMNNSATIKTGTNSALALLVNADAHFTNNTVIDKAVVVATGNVYMDSNASITGAVISTGTKITMTNDSQITTNPETVALVWNNILKEESSGSGGSSGTSNFEIISWQSD